MSNLLVNTFIILTLAAVAGLAFTLLTAASRLSRIRELEPRRNDFDRTSESEPASLEEMQLCAGTPIQTATEDKLERKRYAFALSNALASYKSLDSLVVGLLGPWGTGKSSLLNLLESALKENPKPPIVVRFNPWYFPSEDQLYAQFFRAILAALNQPDLATRYEKASAMIRTFATAIGSLGVLPIIGSVATATGRSIEAVGRQFEERARKLNDLEQLKRMISEALRVNKRRIVIIIDDIDRLTSTEIRLIFKLIKAVADFQFIIYVLAFDREHVARALADTSDDPPGAGDKYLEKIINIPIDIPPITRLQLFDLLVARLNAFAAGRFDEQTAQDERMQRAISNILPLFSTLRELDRFANLLVFNDSLTRGEVDLADFIVLTALQSLEPTLHKFIRDNRELFIDTPEFRLLRNDNEQRKADKAAVETEIGRHRQPIALKELLAFLFPHVDDLLNNRSVSEEDRREWSRQRRACASSDDFDVYFQLSVANYDISKRSMNAILNALGYSNFYQVLTDLKAEDRAIVFLERLKDFVSDERVHRKAEDVVHALLDSSDGFEEDIRGFPIKLDGHILIMQLVYQILRGIPLEEDRFRILERYFDEGPLALEGIVTQLSVEDQAHARYNLGGHLDPSGQLVSDPHLDRLESLAAGLIGVWAKDLRLEQHRRLTYILLRWADWTSRDEVQSFVLNSLPDLGFAKTMVLLASEGLFDPAHGLKWDAPLIARVADPALVRERLRNLKQRNDLDPEIQTLIDRFEA